MAVAGAVVLKRYEVAAMPEGFDTRSTPNIGVDFIAEGFRTFAFAGLWYRLALRLGVDAVLAEERFSIRRLCRKFNTSDQALHDELLREWEGDVAEGAVEFLFGKHVFHWICAVGLVNNFVEPFRGLGH